MPAIFREPTIMLISSHNHANDTGAKSTRARRHSKFERYVKAHETVLRNEAGFSDNPPILGKQFTATETAARSEVLVKSLIRAGRREKRAGHKGVGQAYKALATKLNRCRPKARCGSLACPMCARAFQKTKVAAEDKLIRGFRKLKAGKKLVMVTIIPRAKIFKPDELKNLDVRKSKRWLKDVLQKDGFDRVMLGSADISWEEAGYYQLHWHLAMWTSDQKKLSTRLKKLFPGDKPYARPIVVSKTTDLNFLGYMNKVIKLPDLLRHNRKQLPKLMVALDRTEPLDVILLMRLRLSTRKGCLVLKRTRRRKVKTEAILLPSTVQSVAA